MAKRRAGILLVSLCAGVGGGYAVTVLTPPTYEATASVVITGGAGHEPTAHITIGDLSTGQAFDSSVARNLIPTIARLAESREVALAAATEINMHVNNVVDHISVDSQPNVQIITITAKAGTAAQAATIANAVTHALGLELQRLRLDGTGSIGAVPLDQAMPPAKATLPKPLLNWSLGGLLGLLTGYGLARLRDQLDDKISDVDELRDVTHAPVLASIPFDRRVSKQPLISQRPYSPWSEAFGHLRTNVEFIGVDYPPKVIAVTSPIAGDGKSVTSCNLAIALARAGRRVLLIDADLRRAKCARYLGMDTGAGLTGVLAGHIESESVIQPWGADGLMFLPAGTPPPNPSELLASRMCQDFLRELRDQYDMVLVDLPSLLPVADAAVLAGMADGTILITRHRHTRSKQIRRAVDALTAVNAHLLGCVLNRTPQPDGYGYSYKFDKTPPPENGSTVIARGALTRPIRPPNGQRDDVQKTP
jgi:capsular exopolysaccharide synthesis family protein